MPLTFDAYESMKEKQQEKENDIARLNQDLEELREIVFQLQKEKYGKGEIEMVEKASSDRATSLS